MAHEFSHILNGDMRINIRLTGIIFGIIFLASIGRLLVNMAFLSVVEDGMEKMKEVG